MSYQRGDVVWGPDPFKSGENPRPWLILNNDEHPFAGEDYMVVTLTTTPHDSGIPIDESDWVDGGMPRQSFASPWTVASPKHASLVRRQGRLTEAFVRQFQLLYRLERSIDVLDDFPNSEMRGGHLPA